MKNKLDSIYDDSEVVLKQYFLQQALNLMLLNPFLMAYTKLNQNGTRPKCWYTFSDFNKMQ